MSNVTSSSSSTFTATSGSTNMTTGSPWCNIHGYATCTCFMYGGLPPQATTTICNSCGVAYYINTMHQCTPISTHAHQNICTICGQTYGPHTLHQWPSIVYTSTGTTTISNGVPTFYSYPPFKEVKEITTDEELLIYEWNGGSFNMKLPAKFSDCFLKVGAAWSPLYPLIFSALENDSKEMSFHLVIGIISKIFEGDFVILQAVTTTNIEDNLTLMQLTNRVKTYFKDNDKADSSL